MGHTDEGRFVGRPKKSTTFSRKERAIFLKYCQVLKKYQKNGIPKMRTIYAEVADAFFLENHERVAKVICKMTKSGFYSVDDAETKELLSRLEDLERLNNVF